MGLFVFQCTQGHVFKKLADSEPQAPTCKCGATGVRKPQGNSASVYETLDNGMQPRATVRPADAERIFKEIDLQDRVDNASAPDEQDLARLDGGGQLL